MEHSNIDVKQLKNTMLSTEMLEVDSTVSALNNIANGFKDITIDPNKTYNLQYISDVLTQVVKCFGGTIDNTGSTTFTINISQNDIDNNKNIITLLSKPMTANDAIDSISATIEKIN